MVATSQPPVTAESLKLAFAVSDFIEIPATMDEFWQLVELPEYRLEYQKKHIIGTMSYGSTHHERVVSNMIFELRLVFDDQGYETFGSNRPVYAIGCDDVYNPDVHLIAGELKEYHYKNVKTASLNPAIIVEVHSPSTKGFDLSEKLACYKTIPSVQQIIYIETDQALVTVYNRTAKPNQWLNVDYVDMSQKVKILNRSLPMTKIYKKVEFQPIVKTKRNV
jgi:Uma2 family endonuclease